MMRSRKSPSVLFLIFNRPELTEKVFNVLRKVKPKKLYIAADGPRDGNPDDIENCQRAREIIKKVDWECDVSTLFRKKNLGCRIAITSAIDWFFENEDEGIILEDDCFPSESFFGFSQELLEKYRSNEKIMQINGGFHLNGLKTFSESYYFSKLNSCWGWATWKSAWKHYDSNMEGYDSVKSLGGIEKYYENSEISKWMISYLDEASIPSCGIWSTQWAYSIMKNNGLCVNPTKNMVNNIGFFHEPTSGVHDSFSAYSEYNLEEINGVIHMNKISYDKTNDELEFFNVIKKTDPRLIKTNIRYYLSKALFKMYRLLLGK